MKACLIFIFLCFHVYAADDHPVDTGTLKAPQLGDSAITQPSGSRSFFESLAESWSVQAVAELPFYSFYIGGPAIQGVAYWPNSNPRFGPRILWKDFGTTLTFALPLPERERYRRGDTVATSLVFNSYWREDAMDLYYQRFRGFYVSSPLEEINADKPARFPQLPDAYIINWGMNWYHVLNSGRYSLKAAFNQTEFQTESGGSWLINPFFNHLSINLGSAFIAGSSDHATQSIPGLASGRFDTAGVAGGYGYTYIFKRYFATGQLALGPAIQYQRLNRTEGDNTDAFAPAAKINLNVAAGWNYRTYVGGVTALVDSLSSRVRDTQLASNLLKFQVFIGGRF